MVAAGLGFWAEETAKERQIANALQPFYGEELSFEAKVVREPVVKPDSVQVKIRPHFVSSGNILLTLGLEQDLRYGDRIRVRGVVREPQSFDDFDYAAFLAKDEVYATILQPHVEMLSRGRYEGMREKAMGFIFGAKRRFQEVLRAHVAPPGSQIAGAILLGDKGALSAETQEKLNATGLRHITAISGMHVAVFTGMLMSFLLWLGLWRHHAFYASVVLVLLFVVLTGVQPSAVRAGIMGGMVLLGEYVGRQNVSLRALVFAATALLVANPLLLARDVGFQLSFLAALGIILFLPVFQYLTRKLPEEFHNPRDMIAMSVAAQIFTLPIVLLKFGFVSLVTIVTNLLIVPLLAWFMGFGFAFLLLGSLHESLAFLLSLPVSLFLLFMDAVVEFFSSLPLAAVQTENVSLVWLLFLYIPILHLYWKFHKRQEEYIPF